MKVKLKESELINLIEKVVKEQEETNESVGFTKSYSTELQQDVDAFINVVCGHIKEQVAKKQLYGEEAVVQRMYQLLTEGGELHTPLQELINIIDSLPNKEERPIGFRFGSMSEAQDVNSGNVNQGEITQEPHQVYQPVQGMDEHIDSDMDEKIERSLMDKIMARIKGVSKEQMDYNNEHNLPLDWMGSKEGYHEFVTNKKFPSGSN